MMCVNSVINAVCDSFWEKIKNSKGHSDVLHAILHNSNPQEIKRFKYQLETLIHIIEYEISETLDVHSDDARAIAASIASKGKARFIRATESDDVIKSYDKLKFDRSLADVPSTIYWHKFHDHTGIPETGFWFFQSEVEGLLSGVEEEYDMPTHEWFVARLSSLSS